MPDQKPTLLASCLQGIGAELNAAQKSQPLQTALALSAEELEDLQKIDPRLIADIEKAIAEKRPLNCPSVQWGILPQIKKYRSDPVAYAAAKASNEAENRAESAQKEAEEIKKAVVDRTKAEQPTLLQWCGFPTDMTRVSPFFPLNPRAKTAKRPILDEEVITTGSWGQIRYTGRQLSTYDEDVLLSLLILMQMQHNTGEAQEEQYVSLIELDDGDPEGGEMVVRNYVMDPDTIRQEFPGNGRKTYSYLGPMYRILQMMGKARPSKKDYDRLLKSLEYLHSAQLVLYLSAGHTRTGKARGQRPAQWVHIIDHFTPPDPVTNQISVTLDPYFFETYINGRVTLIDIAQRLKLKSVYSKALYRFVQSHHSHEWRGRAVILADAMNIEPESAEMPKSERVKRVRKAISELQRHKILTHQSTITKAGVALLYRAADTLPRKKKEIREKNQ